MIDPAIYLDMDGVLCDFVGGAFRLFGRRLPAVWPGDGSHDPETLYRLMNTDAADFWATVDRVGETFWAHLPELPWAADLFRRCSRLAPTFVATCPSLHHGCASGKVRWLQRRFGPGFRHYAITPHKIQLARPGAILIDDRLDTVETFVERGGQGMAFRSPENTPGLSWPVWRDRTADWIDRQLLVWVEETLENLRTLQ